MEMRVSLPTLELIEHVNSENIVWTACLGFMLYLLLLCVLPRFMHGSKNNATVVL